MAADGPVERERRAVDPPGERIDEVGRDGRELRPRDQHRLVERVVRARRQRRRRRDPVRRRDERIVRPAVHLDRLPDGEILRAAENLAGLKRGHDERQSLAPGEHAALQGFRRTPARHEGQERAHARGVEVLAALLPELGFAAGLIEPGQPECPVDSGRAQDAGSPEIRAFGRRDPVEARLEGTQAHAVPGPVEPDALDELPVDAQVEFAARGSARFYRPQHGLDCFGVAAHKRPFGRKARSRERVVRIQVDLRPCAAGRQDAQGQKRRHEPDAGETVFHGLPPLRARNRWRTSSNVVRRRTS